jgi:hypothetical protein
VRNSNGIRDFDAPHAWYDSCQRESLTLPEDLLKPKHLHEQSTPVFTSYSRTIDLWLIPIYQFRNRDRSNRPGRGQTEHNVLEGLPINQYREIEVTVGPNTADNKPVDANAWPELPMPRDSHMLPEHSQQLLRAARAGRTIRPPAPPEDDDNEMKEEETEHKEVSVGFTVKKYVKIARHNEAPEPEFLAKRRKGLPSQYIAAQVQAPLRETKVKKLDAEGNVAVYKVLAPEGQAVEGEVAPTDAAIEVVPIVAAPGTVVEGVGVVNAEGIVVANDVLQQTPPRRRPPPPKKKRQGRHIPRAGPGRGRKRVGFVEGAEGAEGQETPTSTAGGEIPAIRGLRTEEGGSVEPSDRDTPMGEAADDDDSGEEGSEDDDQEHDQDHEDETPAPPSQAPVAPSSAPVVEMTDAPEIAAPAEPIIVTEASTAVPLESLQPPAETEQSVLPSASETEEPPTETAAVEAASIEAVTVEAPVIEEPVVEASTVEASAVEASAVEVPVVEVLAVEALTAEAPAAEAPIAEEPITEEPIAEAPAVEAPAVETAATVPDTSNSTDLPSHAGNPSTENSISQPPTSATAIETGASEPLPSELVPAPVPSTETEPLPASVDIPADEPAEEPLSTTQAEPTDAPAQEQPSAPPSAGSPDLLGSLEAELDKE